MKREQIVRLLCLCILFALTATLLLRGLSNTSIGFPDADRNLMDGVFIRDFLQEMPLTKVFEFTATYYARYPALSIGYKPPFFAFVEAIFNILFGINLWGSRLAVLAFALAGVWAYFRLVQRMSDTPTAFFSSSLLVTTPFVAQWGWYTMLEIPALSMCLLASYAFYLFLTDHGKRYLYATAILVPLSAWTKQTAVFTVLWFFLYAALAGKLLGILKRKSTWFAMIIAGMLLIPLAILTIWLGELNIAQSIGGDPPKINLLASNSRSYLLQYIYLIYHQQLTGPVLLLGLAGMALAAAKRHRASLYFACLIAATYIVFTFFVSAKEARYTIFWIPAFTYFAAFPIYQLRNIKLVAKVSSLILVIVILYQIYATYQREPRYATGYDQAAKVALSNLRGPTVLIDAYNNGYFTYFIRSLDPARSTVVLRGDKLLSSSAVWRGQLTIHAHNESDIRDILDKYGVTIIVIETRDYTGIPINRLLRSFLQSEDFELIKEIPIESNSGPLSDNSLKIYRYLKAKPPNAEFITLELPIVGQTLKVPMKKLTDSKKDHP